MCLPSLNSKLCVSRVIFALSTVGLVVPAHAADGPKPVFVHASCDGKISTAVLSSFRGQMGASAKYVMVTRLDDRGLTDVVLEIFVHCSERSDVVSIATSYGKAKCFSLDKCASVVDGGSIRASLCDSSAIAECGRTLFTAFDEYVSRQNETPPH